MIFSYLIRSNLSPNIRLASNIFLVIATFAIVIKFKLIAQVYQRKNLCIKYLKHHVNSYTLIKRLNIVKQANPSSICDTIFKSQLSSNLKYL